MAPSERFETINGCRTRIMRDGQGAPLLFLHGARGAPAWLPFMAALAQRFDVIVPEHPGFGASDTPDWLDRVGDLAYFYLDFLAALKLDRAHVVGTSIGGWIAAEMAVRDCHPLRSLVLSAPAGIHVKGLQKGDIFLWSHEQTVRFLVHDPALAETMLQQPLTDEQQLTEAKNRITMAKLAWQPRLYNPDLHKWLHRIAVPTLILWGANDKVIPAGYGPAFQRRIPGARLEAIESCGHLPQVERAEDWVGRITAFLGEVAP